MNTSAIKFTKIVATIGPATETEETIAELIEAGMNVARFNTKHGTPEWHQERIARVKAVAQRLGVPVGILLDLQGPEIRINVPNSKSFAVTTGDSVLATAQSVEEDTPAVIIPQEVIDALEVGKRILIDDGLGEFEITEKHNASLTLTALGSFEVKHRKTLNTPGTTINLPSLIESDLHFLDSLNGNEVDYVALSFVRNAQDIAILREEMKKRSCETAIMAKIENQSALNNIEEIIAVADTIMVARGDLAVEVPFEELAYWQKKIILRCRQLGRPVLTATQMLKSMVENPRPTRAEVTDVANAVYDGTDAVMLSEETTIGKYPVEAVKTQARIAHFNEQHVNLPALKVARLSPADDIAFAALSLLDNVEDQPEQSKVKKVVCLTETGNTAKLLARYRPDLHIHVLTSNTQTYNQLALVHGVIPHVIDLPENTPLENTANLSEIIAHLGIARSQELVLLIRGIVWKEPGKTSTLSLVSIP